MGSGIYSLGVKDELIERVDSLTRKRNMSRSQIINEIIAEYFNVITPEYKINQVMDLVAKEIRMSDFLQYLSEAKGSSIQCRASIRYKYNPKIRYMLELSGKEKDKLATLNIISRTQREDFFNYLVDFLKIIMLIERKSYSGFSKYSIKNGEFITDGKKFSIDFYYDWTKEHLSIEDISSYLADYIRMIHKAMNAYFEYVDYDANTQIKVINKVYMDYLQGGKIDEYE